MNFPEKGEYNPYFEKYIKLVSEGDFLSGLKNNTTQAIAFFKNIPVNKHDYRYAPDKWTCKDILMHIIDTERVMSFRAFVAIRGDAITPLPPVDENLYARNADVTYRTMESMLEEFEIVRKSTLKLFEHITDEQSRFLGNGVVHPISARALGYIIQGHLLHHIDVINERYL